MEDSPANQSLAVLLPLPLAGCYDYRGEDAMPGDFVVVPLGKREQIGVVWGPGTGEIAEARLKTVIAKLGLPPVHRSGGGLHPGPARRGAAHGDERFGRSRSAAPAGRLASGKRAAG